MRDIFTREERAIVLFLTTGLLVGGLVLAARRVDPRIASELGGPVAECVAGEAAEPAGPVDINTADSSELQRLHGVGPARAEAILELRSERGRFRSVDDLIDVKGIGPATLERIRELAVVLDTESTGGPEETGAAEADTTRTAPTLSGGGGAGGGDRPHSGRPGRELRRE